MIDNALIGKRIREMRKERGLTQGELAEGLSVSFQAVSNWERGAALPDPENLVGIATFLGVLVDDLLRPATGRLLLGVDGGGTKTEFVVATEEGRVLKRIVCGGSNPNDIGLKGTASLIGDGIRGLLTEYPSVHSAFCGISGVSAGDNRAKLLEALTERFPTLRLSVETDCANLFASDDSADLAVICGTGSVVFAKKENRPIRIGGWGHLIDEGGSAYDIGRDALRLALSREDSLKKPSLLSLLLRERLGTATVWDGIGRIYQERKPYIAALSEVVFCALAEGDAEAEAIIDRNAACLAALLRIGTERYGARPRAVASGGIFEHYGDLWIPRIQRHVAVALVSNGLPPVYGAIRGALLQTKRAVPEAFYENFKNSYRGVK